MLLRQSHKSRLDFGVGWKSRPVVGGEWRQPLHQPTTRVGLPERWIPWQGADGHSPDGRSEARRSRAERRHARRGARGGCASSWSLGVDAHAGDAALAAVDVLDISHSFTSADRRLDVLERVSLSVPSGGIAALIGPNGSGKSTLVRIVAGLIRPSAGRVAIGGEDVTGPDPRVGIVFQEPRLLPWRDALRNVTLPLELAGVPDRDALARAGQLLNQVGVGDFSGTRPHQLSGGMRQRVAIARALALQPSVLILDEPFSALDALTRDRFNEELLGLWGRTGATVLVVTHSISEAVFLADRVFVLSQRPGRVVADVPVDLPRPRFRESVDAAAFGQAAQRIRAVLDAAPSEEVAAA
jgi:NitT/TauT family transport system ATP-binding protein